MAHQCWVHDMDAGIPDSSKNALSCLVRFVRHQGTAGQKVRQPPVYFGSELLSDGKNILLNFLREKSALWLFFEPRHFVLTRFSRNPVSVTTLYGIIGFVVLASSVSCG